MQNNRWDNAIVALPPAFVRFDKAVWDYQDKVVFPAGKEFRWLDLRSMLLYGSQVEYIEKIQNKYYVTLEPDRPMHEMQYIQMGDINGDYVIMNRDLGLSRQTEDLMPNLSKVDSRKTSSYWRDMSMTDQEQFTASINSNYSEVRFFLTRDEPYPGQELFLVGRFNDWSPRSEYRMTWDAEAGAYVLRTMLKQGFYNYGYTLRPLGSNSNVSDLSSVDGNWWEAENVYTIFIYYRPIGQMYDRIIGMTQLRSGIR
jgi:Domain of unknown function (DUF5103)